MIFNLNIKKSNKGNEVSFMNDGSETASVGKLTQSDIDEIFADLIFSRISSGFCFD